MLYIDCKSTNPNFNLATEEYVLKEFNDDIFMLWRNGPSIIVGKNQNTLSEINIDYVKENNIPVVRRLSGGGAVFHDLGNLNYTFIFKDNDEIDSFTNFRKYSQPIIDVLNKLGINAEFTGRNDLTIDGRKFSGNAQYNYKNKILHHGCILFSANMTNLTAALKVKPLKFQDKSVKSVVSRVTNISEHLISTLDIIDFKEMVMKHINDTYSNGTIYSFNDKDIDKIQKLVENKYGTWEWNYGNSPKYSFKSHTKFTGGTVEFNIDVEKGIIKDIKIFGDFFGKNDVSEVERILIGVKHNENAVKEALSSIEISNYFANITVAELVDGLTKPE